MDRGDIELKKFVGALRGAMQGAGAFSQAMRARAGAMAGRAASSRAGQMAGRTFGFGAAGRGARDSAYSAVLGNRAAMLSRLPKGRGQTLSMAQRSQALGNQAMGRVAAGQRRNRMIAGGAIGTGVLGGGGALMASRRKGD
jgi:hypothetical protein